MLRVVIPGEPVPLARPRFNRKTGNAYTPATSRAYEEQVAWLCKASGVVFEKGRELTLEVQFFSMERPRQKTADTSNLLKALEDGIQKSGVIWNDVDIKEIHVTHDVDSVFPRADVTLRYRYG